MASSAAGKGPVLDLDPWAALACMGGNKSSRTCSIHSASNHHTHPNPSWAACWAAAQSRKKSHAHAAASRDVRIPAEEPGPLSFFVFQLGWARWAAFGWGDIGKNMATGP